MRYMFNKDEESGEEILDSETLIELNNLLNLVEEELRRLKPEYQVAKVEGDRSVLREMRSSMDGLMAERNMLKAVIDGEAISFDDLFLMDKEEDVEEVMENLEDTVTENVTPILPLMASPRPAILDEPKAVEPEVAEPEAVVEIAEAEGTIEVSEDSCEDVDYEETSEIEAVEEEDFSSYNVKTLKEKAKTAGVKKFSSMRKAELVAVLSGISDTEEEDECEFACLVCGDYPVLQSDPSAPYCSTSCENNTLKVCSNCGRNVYSSWKYCPECKSDMESQAVRPMQLVEPMFPENIAIRDKFDLAFGMLRVPIAIFILLIILIAIVQNSGSSCLLYTSPSPRDLSTSRMPSSA